MTRSRAVGGLGLGLILATLNCRHFERIEGLAVEDWSK